MTNHFIPNTFTSAPKTPWYKKPLTWIITGAVVLVLIIGNGIAGERDAKEANGPLDKTAAAPAEVVPPVKEPAPVAEPAPVEEVAPPEQSLEDLGLVVLRDMYPKFALVDDAVISDAAWAACDLFDTGGSFDMYVLVALDSGITAEEAGALAGFATSAYCPQHSNILG